MSEKKSLGEQIFAFIKTIFGVFAMIILILLLMIIVPNVMRGCQKGSTNATQQLRTP